MKKKNIIFICTDQQSAAMMSCTGNKYLKTPAIDSLAENGVRFERAYCSNPICVPSRFSMFTGRMPSEIGLKENGFPWSENRLPYFLDEFKKNALGWTIKNAGYDTKYGGKVHLPCKTTAEEIGFDYICDDERDELADVCADYIKQKHDKPFFLVASFINPHDICLMAMKKFATEGQDKHLVDIQELEIATLEEALKLPEGVSEKDFFDNYCPPLPPNFEPQQDEPFGVKKIINQRKFKKAARENWSEKEWRMHRWAYAKLTELVDSQIGKVLDAVKTSGIEEETVIIFASDHGDMDSAHRLEHKSVLYEEAARVPLIISEPGKSRKTVDKTHLVSTGLDLYPTICDYAGIKPPEHVKGRSLKPIVDGEKINDWRKFVYVEGTFGDMIVSKRFKYMMHNEGEHAEQLMDLEKDPYEMKNSAYLPENKKVLDELRTQFEKIPKVEQLDKVFY
jgi:choline-sulfatase